MTRYSGLVPKIRKAEARLRVLHELLERETGVTELEGLLLAQLSSMGWTDHVELNRLRKGWGFTRSSAVVSGLKRKKLIDYESIGKLRFRINRWGRDALARFKDQLKDV